MSLTTFKPSVISVLAVIAVLTSTSLVSAPISTATSATSATRSRPVADITTSKTPLPRILSETAERAPGQIVQIIIEKTGPSENTEQAVKLLGGKVSAKLDIIHAFVAEVRAGALPQLARLSSVRAIALDAPVKQSGGPDGTLNAGALQSVYDSAIGAERVWAQGYQGSSVTVAVVDSGWTGHEDFRATPSGGEMRLLTRVGFNGNETNLDDHYAHGVHVAGVIGGNGRKNNGMYIGVAPKVNLVSVKVSDGAGQGRLSGLLLGLQWIYTNRTAYNIRVVNLSLNSADAESYNTSPLDAALEVLWFNGIVVVVSAGNNGSGTSGILYPPANDPFVISVGAVDDHGTADLSDDTLAPFSAYGTTESGFAKPDIVAPGMNIVGPLASGGAELSKAHKDHLVNGKNDYFRMSGTSMSSAVVAGAVALLLQAEPNLTPDQVKYRLMNTSSRQVAMGGRNVPYLNIYNAIANPSTGSANTGVTESQQLWTSGQPMVWNSVQWGSVEWNSVEWNSVEWNSVEWNSIAWSSDYWGR